MWAVQASRLLDDECVCFGPMNLAEEPSQSSMGAVTCYPQHSAAGVLSSRQGQAGREMRLGRVPRLAAAVAVHPVAGPCERVPVRFLALGCCSRCH